ncbi:MAG: ABC transporter permease [Chloroflexi bacterium]|nr:ABC transporter permease [Chloroflexota bacterium]
MSHGSDPGAVEILIQPSRGLASLGLRDLWAYRELVLFLAWRDVKVRYKQSILGIAWVVVQPVVTMIIFSLIFGQLAKLPSEGVPYPLFVYAGILPWLLFSQSLTRSAQSVVGNANLIKKVYFPRLVIPTASTLAVLIDFVVAFGVYVVLMGYFAHAPTLAVLTLPLFVALGLAAALGVGLWLAALNARYRDVAHAIPFLVQAWMFASPVAYATSLVPDSWRLVYAINPMVGVVDGFRWALVDGASGPGAVLAVSASVTAFLAVTGLWYYRQTEKTFADVV